MRLAPLQRIVQRRRRERLAHWRVPQPLRIRRTNIHHRVMHVRRTPRPELRHLYPPVLRKMRGHNFVGVFDFALRRNLHRPWASSPPDQAAEYSIPQPIFAAAARHAHLPQALPPQPTPEIVAICCGVNETSLAKCPYRGSANHGGIIFISTACAIAPAHGASARRSPAAWAQLPRCDGNSGSDPARSAAHLL